MSTKKEYNFFADLISSARVSANKDNATAEEVIDQMQDDLIVFFKSHNNRFDMDKFIEASK